MVLQSLKLRKNSCSNSQVATFDNCHSNKCNKKKRYLKWNQKKLTEIVKKIFHSDIRKNSKMSKFGQNNNTMAQAKKQPRY